MDSSILSLCARRRSSNKAVSCDASTRLCLEPDRAAKDEDSLSTRRRPHYSIQPKGDFGRNESSGVEPISKSAVTGRSPCATVSSLGRSAGGPHLLQSWS